MNNTKPLDASDPTARIYELNDHRFIVSSEYSEAAGEEITKLLLLLMLNDVEDVETPFDKCDNGK